MSQMEEIEYHILKPQKIAKNENNNDYQTLTPNGNFYRTKA